MTRKEELTKLIDDFLGINYDAIYSDKLPGILAEEIIELFPLNTIKEKLYKKALQREMVDAYEDDKYGTSCKSCGAHHPTSKKIFHYRRCPTAQIERILAI